MDSLFPTHDEPSGLAMRAGWQYQARRVRNGKGNDEGIDENEEIEGGEELVDMVVDFDDEHPPFEAMKNVSSNILMHNNALLWQDLLFYWEFKTSVKEGDVSRSFEVIKVSCHLGLHICKLV